MGNFTTVDEVRHEAGFDNNPNVLDSTIEGYIDDANGILLSYLGSRYDITSFSGTSFEGSHAEKFIKRHEKNLAAGYLLIKEYGTSAIDTDKDGYERIEQSEMFLGKITSGEVRLFKSDGSELSIVSAPHDGPEGVVGGGLAGSTGERHFSIDQEF